MATFGAATEPTAIYIYIYMRAVKLGSGPIWRFLKVRFWANLKVRFLSKMIFGLFLWLFQEFFAQKFVLCVWGLQGGPPKIKKMKKWMFAKLV